MSHPVAFFASKILSILVRCPTYYFRVDISLFLVHLLLVVGVIGYQRRPQHGDGTLVVAQTETETDGCLSTRITFGSCWFLFALILWSHQQENCSCIATSGWQWPIWAPIGAFNVVIIAIKCPGSKWKLGAMWQTLPVALRVSQATDILGILIAVLDARKSVFPDGANNGIRKSLRL